MAEQLWAYLWTPDDVVRLDLAPELERSQRGLARLDAHNCRATAPCYQLARRRAEAHKLLEDLCEEVRRLPHHDWHAAAALIACTEARPVDTAAAGHIYLLENAVNTIRFRLRPYRIGGTSTRPIPSIVVLKRVEELRHGLGLVYCPPPVGGALLP